MKTQHVIQRTEFQKMNRVLIKMKGMLIFRVRTVLWRYMDPLCSLIACNTKLCISDRSSPIWELSLYHPKHSKLDCYVNEVIQLWQVICLYTKSYCPLESLGYGGKKNCARTHARTHTTGCITVFITFNITHVWQISHLIFLKEKKYVKKILLWLLIADG